MRERAFAGRSEVSDDYQDLLARGYVVRRYANARRWADAMRAAARADGLTVEGAISSSDPDLGWTILRRASSSDPMYETAQVMLIREVALHAVRDSGRKRPRGRD